MVRSAAGTVATNSIGFPAVAATYVVGNVAMVAPLVHCTTEQGTRFVPVTVSVVPDAPAVAEAGNTLEIDGAGGAAAEIANALAFERTPEFET